MNSFSKLSLALALGVLLPVSFAYAEAPMLKSATITAIKNDAKLYVYDSKNKETIRPAKVKDMIDGNRALRTGKGSRAELEFNDKSIARIGANTVFSFKPGTRKLDLQKGTLLLQVPKGYGNTQVATPAATCSVIGTTILLQHLQLANGQSRSVNVVLEGLMNVVMNGHTYQIPAGSALISGGPGVEPQMIKVDVGALMSTSSLTTQFPTLPSNEAIQQTVQSQEGQKIEPLSQNLATILGTDYKTVAQEVEARPDAVAPPKQDPPLVAPPPDEEGGGQGSAI